MAAIEFNPQTHSTARAIITGYYRFISPKLTGVDFPRSLRRHPADPECSFEGGNKYLVLYYHIGNALDALYTAYRIDDVDEKGATLLTLENRTKLLERLATRTIHQWFLIGDERTGYRLDINKPGEGSTPKRRNNLLFDELGNKRK